MRVGILGSGSMGGKLGTLADPIFTAAGSDNKARPHARR